MQFRLHASLLCPQSSQDKSHVVPPTVRYEAVSAFIATHSYGYRYARLMFTQENLDRPMELRRRLYLGRLAGGLSIKGECDGRMVSPLEAARMRTPL